MTVETRKIIGNAIKEARLAAGLTQTELAVALGHKSPAFLSFVEKGMRNISAECLNRVASILGREVQYFYSPVPPLEQVILTLSKGSSVTVNGVPLKLLSDTQVLAHPNNVALLRL